MIERLEIILERYNQLCEELLKPEVYEDYKKMQTVSKEKNSIEKTVEAYKNYNRVLDDIEACKEMAKDPDMREFAAEEIENLHSQRDNLESKLKRMLLLKSEELLVVMKQTYLQVIYLECILSMLKNKDGN